MRDERFILKVVKMYYKNGMSQVDIGKKLNVSRMTVARILEQARQEGYVQIIINNPENSVTEEEEILEKKFNLKEAIIAYPEKGEVVEEIGYLTADYMLRILKNSMTLALTKGTTLQKVIECLETDVDMKFRIKKYKNVKVVPLSGSDNPPMSVEEKYRLAYSNYLIESMAKTLKVDAYQIMAPLVVADVETRDKFLNEFSVQQVVQLAENSDVAIFGIGSLDDKSSMKLSETISTEELERLKSKGGVGEVVCHVFDEEGNLIDDPFDNRLVSLSLEQIKKIPIRVGVAYGENKGEAVLGALKAGIINVLITDMEVASYLMKK